MPNIINLLTSIRVADIIDVVVVAFILYKLFMLIRETRAEQLVKGIAVVLVFSKVAEWLKLYTITWILSNALTVGVLIVLVVFQPELRRGLEYIGRSNILQKSLVEIRGETVDHNSDEIVSAVSSLARQKIGALIVLENETGLGDIVETGTPLNADVSSELLINIFIPNTPLHDGAVVIKDDRIRAAACFLPLTENASLSRELGTRHRAALGMTEKSDAVVIIVSEETGTVSIADKGQLSRHVDDETLKTILYNFFVNEKTGLFSTWRNKHEDTKE